MSYATQLLEKKEIARDTLALTLTRPEGFSFRAGQYAILSIPGVNDGYDREFSIASAPAEDNLEFVMRIRDSEFKSACMTLPNGSPLLLSDASGSIAPFDDGRNELWIAGGVGATPFRSIVRSMTRTDSIPDVILIHSNRTEEDAPFADDFRRVQAHYPTFSYMPFFTHEKRRLDAQILKSLAPDYMTRMTTVIGTRPFVAAMYEALAENGVPLEQMRKERFCGYTTHTNNEQKSTHTQQVPISRRIT